MFIAGTIIASLTNPINNIIIINHLCMYIYITTIVNNINITQSKEELNDYISSVSSISEFESEINPHSLSSTISPSLKECSGNGIRRSSEL